MSLSRAAVFAVRLAATFGAAAFAVAAPIAMFSTVSAADAPPPAPPSASTHGHSWIG